MGHGSLVVAGALLFLVLHLACDVGLKELVLSTDLLIVLLDVHQAIMELLQLHLFEGGGQLLHASHQTLHLYFILKLYKRWD